MNASIMIFLLTGVALALVFLLLSLLRGNKERDEAKAALDAYANKFDAYADYRARLSTIAADLQRATTFDELARVFLSHATPLIGAQYGTLYLMDEAEGRLTQAKGYASATEDGAPRRFALGEGLVGQCAVDRLPVTIHTLPDTDIRILSGVGKTVPKQILLQAILQKDRTVGVLEFAAVDAFTELTPQFLSEVMPTLAMSMEILDRSQRTQSLLAASREQAEQLEAQQTALKASFVERDAASRALKLQVDDLAGARRAMLNIMEDLETSRVLAEEAAKTQVAIFESLTHGIGFIKDRIILRANSKHAELFGRGMDEIEGQSARVWYPDDEAYVQSGASVDEDLRRGVTHVRDQQLQRKDGSLFWCHISARAVDSQDLSRGLVCVLEDISARRLAENEMKERMQELERFTRLTIDREEKMIRLKEEVNDLLEQAGKKKKYKIVD